MRELIVLIAVLTGATYAQSPSVDPSFEVASIKPNKSDSRMVNITAQGGRLTATNVSLNTLIRIAYGDPRALPANRVIGGPSWIGQSGTSYLAADRFDIVAKAEGDPAPDQMSRMLRTLLADRFKLVLHQETRELPIYALVMARNDRRLGSRLRLSNVDCSADAPPPATAGSDQSQRPCQMRTFPGKLTGQGTIAALARSLTGSVDDHRPVQDRTGLAGTFEFDLEWTPDQVRQPPPDAPAFPPIDPNGASLFTAIQEQLGLKLEPANDHIDILVVDRAERPTED